MATRSSLTRRSGEYSSMEGASASGEVTPRSSMEIARQFQETKQRISFAQEQAKAGNVQGQRTMDDFKKELDMDEHRTPMDELVARHATDLTNGLSKDDHARRLQRNGRNELTPPPQVHWFIKFGSQFLNFFALLLQAGAVLCFVAYGLDSDAKDYLYLGLVLYIVVFLTSCFSHYQEARSAAVMEGFKNMIRTETKVIRDGVAQQVDAVELVVGDIVELVAGNRVPADIRVVSQTGMKVDNSALTGEADPQSRSAHPTDDNPLETKNLAFFGTLVVEGSCRGMVIQTGDWTLMGRIAGLAAGTVAEDTPIHKEIHHFVVIISVVAMILGVSFFIIGVVKGTEIVYNLVFMIGIIVANVPEGLLATVTVSLTLTANRMSMKQVLVKNLESVETLGSTTTICSDKTGTLTQNRMTVVHVLYDQDIFPCDTAVTKGQYDRESPGFKALYRVGALCSRSNFSMEPENLALPIRERVVLGDASETAILKFCESENTVGPVREAHPKLAEIPFNSTNKFQLSIHELGDKSDSRRLLVLKGASEKVISLCTNVFYKGQVVPMTDDRRDALNKALEKLGGMGERVLAFAELYLDGKTYHKDFEYDTDEPNFPMEGFTFVGLMALLDPPREAVPTAVHKCKEAGIRVIMVTGDHPITAKAISKQVGIITEDTIEDIAEREGCKKEDVDPKRAKAIVIHGQDMKDLTPEDWTRILDHEQVVFARTSPQQKLLIVEACQRRGDIVAVTGDGVNDSPALKKADIGVAMGISGSDVSKEAADMVLMDDNFASIVNGVEEGRLVFDNLKKSIAYTLSSNIPEITPFLAYITMGLPLPLSTIMILCVDLGTDMIPAISLAHEHAESDIMRRPPRNAKVDRLVTKKLISFAYLQIGVLQALAGFYTYFIVLNDYGFPPKVLPGLNSSDDWGNNMLWCRWDDFPTYNMEGGPRPYDQVLAGIPLGDEPYKCRYYDAEDAFTEENYLANKFGDYIPYAVPAYQESRLEHAQTAFFVCIVVVQVADVIICKTRKLSVFTQGMHNNVLNFGFVSETVLACIICYVSFINTGLMSAPIRFQHWLTGVPFSLVIFLYDEVRKFLIRRSPGGWIDRNTYW